MKEINGEKVKPKFHKGDWIIHQGTENIYQVVAIIDNQYQLKYGDNYTVQKCDDVDRCARLWDITKDAKDGDVLAVENIIFIYERTLAKHIVSYCKLINNIFEPFDDARTCCEGNSKVHPATKEQRDTLEKAIADAGWEFDFESKELKKIENEIEIPFGSKDSELQEVTYFIPKGFHAEIDDEKVVIKKGEKPTTWSEEDDEMQKNIEVRLHTHPEIGISEFMKSCYWLKSLHPQKQWKPSDEQMDALDYYANSLCTYCDRQDDLRSLFNDLKKL